MIVNVKEAEIQERHLLLNFNQVEEKYELNMEYPSGEVIELEEFYNREEALIAFKELVKKS